MSEPNTEETVTLPVVEVERLRRAVAELEVKSQALDDEAFALRRQVRETREQLDLSNRRVADLEATSEAIVLSLKMKSDEMEESLAAERKAQSALRERHRRVEDLLKEFATAGERIAELESALSLKERLA